ncbi:hypothetical protein AGMMS49940_05580 [Spirochaetia bacterium]|nr:hypothetical protein AGMMS49940_05580 [Spirochaetia bacterium]
MVNEKKVGIVLVLMAVVATIAFAAIPEEGLFKCTNSGEHVAYIWINTGLNQKARGIAFMDSSKNMIRSVTGTVSGNTLTYSIDGRTNAKITFANDTTLSFSGKTYVYESDHPY